MNEIIDYEKLKLFYIGKEKLEDGTKIPLVYKNKDLRTHAAIIGMTGSGKTGLGISLLEEAAIDNIPSIIIDPKGDMGNLLLTFPKLQGDDFEPWIEEQDAINNGTTVKQQAINTAKLWENGIKNDFQSKERIQKLKDSANFTIYTPGSTAGVQISILQTFKAPSKEILQDNDLLVSVVNSTVSSILSLIDNKIDSTSKEAILLSSIFMNFFTKGEDLSLEKLITLIVNPPFSKIGIFDIDTFFSQDDRLKLALKLNSIIANPSFKTWIEGEALDISKLLYDENGKAKISIFTISHLNDSQRMFFVSILLNQMLSWMRRQEGTSSLKALLYMDEIYGYFPPSKNPPSKQAMMTLLKQARSFGVGIILSTQNPVDLDYKGLSNIGTWFIGRLQTKQDINKVIDGLSNASEKSFNKQELTELISNLQKRTFILKNINEDKIKVFQTRWVLSYLKGPLTKDNIRELMKNIKNKTIPHKEKIQKPIKQMKEEYKKPLLPNNFMEKYLYNSQNSSYYLQGYLLCECKINFINNSKNIDTTENFIHKIYLNDTMKEINFKEFEPLYKNDFEENERVNSSYYPIPSFLQNEKELKNLLKDFSNYIYRNERLTLYYNKKLKLYSKQDESFEDFKLRVQDRLNEIVDEQIEKLQEKYKKKEESLENKLENLYDKLDKEEQQASTTTTNTLISIGSSILGAFFGRSLVSKTNIGKVATSARGATKILKERNDIKIVEGNIEELKKDIQLLKEDLENEVEKINKTYHFNNYETEEYLLKPRRKDIYDLKISLLWQEE